MINNYHVSYLVGFGLWYTTALHIALIILLPTLLLDARRCDKENKLLVLFLSTVFMPFCLLSSASGVFIFLPVYYIPIAIAAYKWELPLHPCVIFLALLLMIVGFHWLMAVGYICWRYGECI